MGCRQGTFAALRKMDRRASSWSPQGKAEWGLLLALGLLEEDTVPGSPGDGAPGRRHGVPVTVILAFAPGAQSDCCVGIAEFISRGGWRERRPLDP